MMDEDARTLYCGNLSDKVTEDILYELFLQGGPVQKISIPKDRDGKPRSYAFITYKHLHSVQYALHLFEDTLLYNRSLNMRLRNNEEQHQQAEQLQKSIRNQMNQMLELGHQMVLGNYPPQFNNGMLSVNGSHAPAYPKQFDTNCGNNDKNRNYPYHRKDKNHERNRNKDRDRKHENKARNRDRDRNREHNLSDYSRNDKSHYNRESDYTRYRSNSYSHHNENRKRWTYH